MESRSDRNDEPECASCAVEWFYASRVAVNESELRAPDWMVDGPARASGGVWTQRCRSNPSTTYGWQMYDWPDGGHASATMTPAPR